MSEPRYKVGDILTDPLHNGHVFYVIKLTDSEYLTIASHGFWIKEVEFNNLSPFKHHSLDTHPNVIQIGELDKEMVEILYL